MLFLKSLFGFAASTSALKVFYTVPSGLIGHRLRVRLRCSATPR